MSFKLGDKVAFTRSLSKQSGYGVDMSNYTEDQKKQLEEHGHIRLNRYKERQHKQKQGIVCGKRNIVTIAILEEIEDPYRGWHIAQTDQDCEMVYVVACDMRGLYRVRAEDLELVKEESA